MVNCCITDSTWWNSSIHNDCYQSIVQTKLRKFADTKPQKHPAIFCISSSEQAFACCHSNKSMHCPPPKMHEQTLWFGFGLGWMLFPKPIIQQIVYIIINTTRSIMSLSMIRGQVHFIILQLWTVTRLPLNPSRN